MSKVIYKKADEKMLNAYEDARSTFKYFYRELMWDQRRVISAIQTACVKVLIEEGEIGEHMWIDNIYFDGIKIHGILTNIPRELKNIKQGDKVSVLVKEITDWLFVIDDRAYGAFTVQVIRSQMDAASRMKHDNAWGINFGDYNKPIVAYNQEIDESVLIEHPMAINSKENYIELINNNPNYINEVDYLGNTILHFEAMCGNKTMIEILINNGIDLNLKNNLNQTAYDIAVNMGWDHIIDLLKG